jgi:hypothetical protein
MKLLSLLATSLLIGCAVTDDVETTTDDVQSLTRCDLDLRVDFDHIAIDGKPAGDPSPGPQLDRFELHVDADALAPSGATDVCDCADDQCVVDWVAESFGCGTCARIRCDGFDVGACAPCVDSQAACVFD